MFLLIPFIFPFKSFLLLSDYEGCFTSLPQTLSHREEWTVRTIFTKRPEGRLTHFSTNLTDAPRQPFQDLSSQYWPWSEALKIVFNFKINMCSAFFPFFSSWWKSSTNRRWGVAGGRRRSNHRLWSSKRASLPGDMTAFPDWLTACSSGVNLNLIPSRGIPHPNLWATKIHGTAPH